MKIDGNMEKYYYYSFPMQAVLVTCNDKDGKTNVITIAWHMPISKNPPLYGISVAPKRHSYKLIEESKEFVINFAPYTLNEKVNFCGTHSGRNTDKIDETKLTLIPSEKIKVPSIKECFAHMECKVHDIIQQGDHMLIVGEVQSVKADENKFIDDILDISKTQPLYYLGGNKYTSIDKSMKKEL